MQSQASIPSRSPWLIIRCPMALRSLSYGPLSMPKLPVEKWVQRTTVEYTQGWNNLLPTGPAWPRESTTALQKVVTGLSGIWGNPVDANAALLLQTESDPRSTNMLLPDWERAWGLPDLCIPIPTTNVALR